MGCRLPRLSSNRVASVMTILVFMALGACAGSDLPEQRSITKSRNQSDNIYSHVSESLADKRLDDFGVSNPKCLAWTDWNRTCSRLNSDGQNLHCNTTVSWVKRSIPFCLAEDGVQDAPIVPIDKGSADAFNRFCTSFRIFDGQSVCFSRRNDRPFAGFHIAEVRHPFCEIWGNKDGQYCTEKSDGSGLPSCKEMEAASRTSSPLTCFKQDREARLRAGCARVMIAVLDNYPTLENEGTILPVAIRQPQTPLASIYCREWEDQ